MVTKWGPSIQEPHLNLKDRHYLIVNGWEKIFQSNVPKKQSGVAFLISNIIDFKLKLVKRDGERYLILIIIKIHQD